MAKAYTILSAELYKMAVCHPSHAIDRGLKVPKKKLGPNGTFLGKAEEPIWLIKGVYLRIGAHTGHFEFKGKWYRPFKKWGRHSEHGQSFDVYLKYLDGRTETIKGVTHLARVPGGTKFTKDDLPGGGFYSTSMVPGALQITWTDENGKAFTKVYTGLEAWKSPQHEEAGQVAHLPFAYLCIQLTEKELAAGDPEPITHIEEEK